jgi:hypothetical protein
LDAALEGHFQSRGKRAALTEGGPYQPLVENCRDMKTNFVLVASVFCGACVNPGGITDEAYAMYKDLGPPRLIWACTLPNRVLPEAGSRLSECMALQDESAHVACMKELEVWKSGSTTEMGMAAGFEGATYDVLVEHQRSACDGEFEVLESDR